MKYQPYLPKAVLALAMLALTFTTSAKAETGAASHGWQHRLVVYGWFPDIEGTFNFDIPGSGNSARAEASDLIDNLEAVFMGAYEGRRGKWSIKVDVLYLDLDNSADKSVTIPVGPGSTAKVRADLGLTGWQVGLYGGYSVMQAEQATVDLLTGLRYLSLETDAKVIINGPLPPTLPSATLSQSVDFWDAVVGLKGQYNFNENWYVPYHVDIGAGDSDLTWQVLAGVGYRFDWGSVMLAYRHLYYDQGSSGKLQDLEFSGPAVGVSFSF